MGDEAHLAILRQGVEVWNGWRKDHPGTKPDLTRANLTEANLTEANLTRANLTRANLSEANLSEANLSEANLSEASLTGANLTGANLSEASLTGANLFGADLFGADLFGADLSEADLSEADLSRADLSRADLSRADLPGASFVGTTIAEATLTGASVYGTSVWDPRGTPKDQTDLVITPPGEPAVTVDDLEVAQFMYLMLHNEKIRRVIDTITSKVVLILGRFTDERKHVLDRLRDELRCRNLSPVLFDFDAPKDPNITKTVTLLARMARFVIADLTDPRSIPQELQAIVPHLPSVPVQPIILAGQEPWAMFPDLRDYPWMLKPYPYANLETLLENLETAVIAPPDDYRTELDARRQARESADDL